ncbi:serine/threonine protein kinase [Actinomadura chokoriensis]|uniref:serine/threonine protein kinase n=1 Tax=Actinomadura chokoriensis TaxID=454156 RepID=UPI0031F7FF84
MAERTDLLPTDPDSVGPYRLRHRLGTGGQGTVYIGADGTGASVAVKLLHPHLIGNEVARTRFVREMQIAERVAPFCTAQVLDSGVADGHVYIVSEFVDGPSLQDSVRAAGPRGGAALERLAINTVTALAAIHRAEVVHRDFKPGNVLLGPDGPVVIDFGIARALDLNQSIITSQAVGTPGYMAPEQIAEEAVGPAADMFAWGATMVFAATGERPFRGTSIPAVMQAILRGEPELDGLQGPLRAIVRDCLAKDPSRRPTAAEVGDRLRALPAPAWETKGSAPTRHDETAASDPQPDTAPGRRRRRRALLIGTGMAALITAMAGGAYTVLPSGKGDGTSEVSETPEAAISPVAPTDGPTASPSDTPSGERTPAPSKSTAGDAGRRSAPATGKAPGDQGSRTARPSQPPGGGGGQEEAPSTPKTLGTISASDGSTYCRSRGYAGAVNQYDGNYSCYGAPGRVTVTITQLCRWKYPGSSNVKADGTTCKSY